MIRQQKRKRLRDLAKEKNKIIYNKDFQKVLKSKDFVGLSADELNLLKSRTHTNKKLQDQFDYECLLLARLTEIEKEEQELVKI